MNRVNTGLVIDRHVMEELDAWAKAEFRSRNSLINQILAQAVRNKRQAYPALAASPADADMHDRAQVAAQVAADATLR